jgi:hypothetical protein
VAEGSTVQVFLDLVTGAVVRMPAPLRERIVAFEGRSLPTRGAGLARAGRQP